MNIPPVTTRKNKIIILTKGIFNSKKHTQKEESAENMASINLYNLEDSDKAHNITSQCIAT